MSKDLKNENLLSLMWILKTQSLQIFGMSYQNQKKMLWHKAHEANEEFLKLR